MADWTQAYAKALGIKWTPQVSARLQQWQRWEGGSTHNSATNNYMNTKLKMPGSFDAIGNGVQGYRTLGQGALAFAKTMRNGNYPTLSQWLATGQGDPSHDLQVWVAGPGGIGSASATSYARKVLGGAGSTEDIPPPAPQQGPATPTSLPTDLSGVRRQAAEGFAAIAQGTKRPDETFGPLLDTLKAARANPQPVSAPQTPGGSPAVTVDIPGSTKLERQAANLVRTYLGVKYQWGGTSAKTGFDCSGLVQYVWKTLGVNIPRTTFEQWDAGHPVGQGDLRPGDEVFFTGSDARNGKPGHEGMYIGNGLFIEAAHTGTNVRVSKLSSRGDYVGARRFA